MKKTILSLALVSSALFASAQTTPGLSTSAAFDDFAVTDNYGVQTEDTKWDDATSAPVTGEKAFKGIMWGGDAAVLTTNTRAGDGKGVFGTTQAQGAYQPFVALFGTYADASSKKAYYTIDLSNDANLSFSVKNAGTEKIRVSVQVQDKNDVSLVYMAGATQAAFYNFNLGFVQGETAGLVAGATGDFAYDLKTALVGTQPGNVVITDGSVVFDYSAVKMVLITVVSDANTGDTGDEATSWKPLALTDYPVEITNFKIGDVSTITGVENNFLAANNNEVVSVYDMMGKFVATGKLNTLGLEAGKLYVVKSGNKSRKIVMN